MVWYVLACDGGYLGATWQSSGSGGIVDPRMAIIPSLNPPPLQVVSLCHGTAEYEALALRGREVLGIASWPAAVEFVGRGKDAALKLPGN